MARHSLVHGLYPPSTDPAIQFAALVVCPLIHGPTELSSKVVSVGRYMLDLASKSIPDHEQVDRLADAEFLAAFLVPQRGSGVRLSSYLVG